MRRQRWVAVATAAVLAEAGCASTSYTPRGDGRIATVIEDGSLNLIKDGRRYPVGADGLKQAVEGNPAAEEHARAYADHIHFGLAENLIGLGAILVGAIVIAPRQDAAGKDLPVSSGREVAGGALLVGGLAAMIISTFQLAAAQAHYMDAINIYNDGVPPRLPGPPPAWQPTSPVPLAPPPAPPASAEPPTPQAYPPPPMPPVAPPAN